MFTKAKALFYNWKFIFNYFFRPWLIESEIKSQLKGLEHFNYRLEINRLKDIVKCQQAECQLLSDAIDNAGRQVRIARGEEVEEVIVIRTGDAARWQQTDDNRVPTTHENFMKEVVIPRLEKK